VDAYKDEWYNEGVGNLKKWTKGQGGGKEFGEWVAESKDVFA
jgi:hypothetical protein